MSEKRGGSENLVPVQSSEEARIRGRNGGIKSGETRRAKKQMRELARMFLDMKTTENVANNLAKFGIQESDQTNMMALLVSLYTNAMNGNIQAFRTLMEYAGMNPNQELLDMELESRIEAIEMRQEGDDFVEVGEDDDVIIYLPDNGRNDSRGNATK